MSGHRFFLRVLLALALLVAARAEALEMRQVLWSFDGRLVPGRFNPVSVLMVNPGGAAFDGTLTLAPVPGLGGPRGAACVQPVFLAPQSARWVQFAVFVGRVPEELVLSWGRGAKEREIFDREIPTGPPACVWLLDPNDAFSRPGAFKTFPDQLFPTTVAATDALDSVILDYAPRWEPARREAFLDWLHRGGIVHVLAGANGEFPVFTETLAVLNGEGESARVGAGQVVRHRGARVDFTEKTLTARGFPPRELKSPQNAVIHDLEETFYQRLASLTRPKVSWWLLNLLTFLYIAVIGPVAFRTARRIDYRWAIGGFLAVVAAFGLAFAVIGRRGYGESQTVHSLAIAHSLGGARWDVTQWLSAFATSSGQYTLTHAAPANLYATSTRGEVAAGQVINGKDGKFLAEIPLYSSRTFTHRGVMQGDDLGVTVEKWETKIEGSGGVNSSMLKALVLKPGPGFPSDAFDVVALYGNRIYALTKDGSNYALQGGNATLGDALQREKLQQLRNTVSHGSADRTPEARLRETIPLLQARAFGTSHIAPEVPERPLAANQLRLFIAAPAPPGFHMQGEGFAHENGVVLYVQDVFQP